jgi:hypothetical protein
VIVCTVVQVRRRALVMLPVYLRET